MSTPTKDNTKEESQAAGETGHPPDVVVSSQQPEKDTKASHDEGSDNSPGAQHSSTTDDKASLKATMKEVGIGRPVAPLEPTQGTGQGPDWSFVTVQPLPSTVEPSPRTLAGTGVPVEDGPGAYNVGGADPSEEGNPNSGSRDLEAGRNDNNDDGDATQEQEQEQPQHPACEHVVEAVKVEDDHVQRQRLEQEIRNSILSGAVQADVIAEGSSVEENESDLKNPKKVSASFLYGFLALILVVALGLGLGLGLSSSKNEQEDPSAEKVDDAIVVRPALEVVKERGFVRCGTNDLAFASMVDPEVSDEMEGLNVEQCRAMALLALGDPDKYELVWATSQNRFESLAAGDFDMLAEGTTHTMGRDVFEDYAKANFTFTTPYFYSGLVFGGVPAYVDCADRVEDFEGDCRKLKICVGERTTHLEILSEILGGGTLVPYNTVEELVESYRSGSCNCIASEPLFLMKLQADYFSSSDSEEFQGWTLGAKTFSKEPLALVTRQDDPEWSAMADLSVNAFYLAEAYNITKDNAGDMADLAMSRQGHQASEDFIASLVSLISEFGNYADLYELHVEYKVPRQQGLNTVYDRRKSSGLLYSIPFGNVAALGPDPVVNGTLAAILERGRLVCGIMPSRGPGFALFNTESDSWTGFDVEFCKGVAAALFAGDASKIVFVELQSMALSYMALASGTVDLVAGARVTMEASLHEPSTGVGYRFSSPYYYDNDSRDASAFMTQNNQLQWSDFVYWIVMGTIFAEEEGITAESSTEMPIVSLFGQHLKQMFRDAISAVGNYAELYNSTLENVIPREGANMLNEGLAGPQLFPIYIN